MRWFATLVTVMVGLGLGGQVLRAEVIWHHPPDRVVVGGGGVVHAVLEVRGSDPAALRLRLNEVPVLPREPLPRTARGSVVHYALQLEAGLNTLEVVEGEGKIRQEAYFLTSWGEEKRPPAGFKPLVFHLPQGPERQCQGCHDLQPKAQDRRPASPRESTCYPCHAQITSYKEVHGPASQWACTFCHDADSTPARYATPQPVVSDLCFRCHLELKEYYEAGPYQHGPTATGRCTICHNPHATNNPFWLKRAPWYLCTTCHTEKASGRHVIAWGPSGDTHPTRSKPDPMRPTMELACNSCHNPHAAPSPKLWQFKAKTHFQLCQTCHRK